LLTFSTFGLFALQKIQIKTLKGDVFKIDGEPTDTVMDLKTKIEAAHGAEMAADRLRLILEGKVLKDTQTVAEINVTEQSFIVCMVSKDTKVGFLVFSIYLLCHTLSCSPPRFLHTAQARTRSRRSSRHNARCCWHHVARRSIGYDDDPSSASTADSPSNL